MLRNYLIIALRTILRNRVYSFINIVGLSAGITSCILIFIYIQDEMSFDRHWKNAERVMKINQIFTDKGVVDPYSCTSFFMAPQLKEALPEIEEIVRIDPHNHQSVSYQDRYFNEDRQYTVDPDFLKVFDFELLKGDPKTCLAEPGCVVISEDMAQRFFGSEDPMGKMLRYPRKLYKVTGVLKNTSLESHLKPNALLSMNPSKRNARPDDWFRLSVFTYAKLKTATSPEEFDKKLELWASKVLDPAVKENKFSFTTDLKSQKLTDVYFDNYHLFNQFESGAKKYLSIFGWIALFILVIACFNYMNLSTARALKRAREVGLRKVVGADRQQLIFQFLGESLCITVLAILFSFILLFAVTPAFNSITGKNIHFGTMFGNTGFWTALTIITLFISLVGGSYPAFYLSNFRPAAVLKGKLVEMRGLSFFDNFKLRQLLVVAQFTISTIIIIATIMVYKQLMLMKNKDLGFNKDQVMVLKFPAYMDSAAFAKIEPFKNELLSNHSILNFATTENFVGAGRVDFFVKDNGKNYSTTMNINWSDYNYIDLLGIKLKAGRNFSKEIHEDHFNFILNEAALKFLNWSDPTGKEISLDGSHFGKVIGIIKDFNYKSPHSKIEPLALALPMERNATASMAMIRIRPENIRKSVELINQTWKSYFRENAISSFFLDDKFNEQYKKDTTMLVLFTCFSGLTILISCMGLLGLASFSTEQRIKEIGIRKVLGAGVSNITFLVSKDFITLVIIAFLVASPVAWYIVNSWLQDFAYRTQLSIGVFMLAGGTAILIAFASISFQTIRAATANPVKSLRTE